MTDLRTAAQQALEALSLALSDVDWRANSPTQPVIHKAHTALRAALAEPEPPIGKASTDVGVPVFVVKKAEPVQEQCKGDPGECEFNGGCMYACAKPEPPLHKGEAMTDCANAIIALRAALAEPVEPVKHKHQWFSTGAMEPGEMRCIHCGAWAKEKNT